MTAPYSNEARLRRAVQGLRERGALSLVDTDDLGSGLEELVAQHYRTRRALLRRLREEFAGATLDDRFGSVRRCQTRPGVHVVRHEAVAASPALPTPEAAATTLLGCLEIVFGVGAVTARRLRAQGYRTLEDLLAVPTLCYGAADVLDEWERFDLAAICARLTARLGERGHLLSALACSLVDIEDIAFLDLETMGLWNNVVFLAGIGRVRDGQLRIEQFLAPSHADEPAVVAQAVESLASARIVVTFNGRTADLPWLMSRALYYGLAPVPPLAHVDLIYGTRRCYIRDEDRLPNARLPVVSDQLLSLPRPGSDVPGWLVPEIYASYSRAPEAREGMLVPVIEHNRADLQALVHLLELLSGRAVAWQGANV